MVMPSGSDTESPLAAAPVVAPAVATRGYRGWRLVAVSLLILIPALAVIGIVIFIGVRISPTALIVGLVGAILPVPVLVACFLWLDRYQPSPLWLIACCFLWGAGVATSGALVLEELAAAALDRLHQPDTLLAVVGAPLAEESFKAALPILLLIFYRRGVFPGTHRGGFCGVSAARVFLGGDG